MQTFEVGPLETVVTAGGVLIEQLTNEDGTTQPAIWLVANRESVRANKQDPTVPITYQLPKGHVMPGEIPSVTAVREVGEEVGALAVAGALLDVIEREANEYSEDGSTRRVIKRVVMFMVDRAAGPMPAREVDETAELLPLDDALVERMFYPEEGKFILEYVLPLVDPTATEASISGVQNVPTRR